MSRKVNQQHVFEITTCVNFTGFYFADSGRVIDWSINFLKTASGASSVYEVDFTALIQGEADAVATPVEVDCLFSCFPVFVCLPVNTCLPVCVCLLVNTCHLVCVCLPVNTCLPVCVCVPVNICLPVCVCLSTPAYPSIVLPLCVSLPVSTCLPVYICLPVNICLPVSFPASQSVCVCLSTPAYLSVVLPLRWIFENAL